MPIISARKRQLPNIPTAQLHVNREKGLSHFFCFRRSYWFCCIELNLLVSQDLLEKATQLKLRLHLQSKTDKPLLTQHSFDQSVSMTKQMNRNLMNIADRPSRQSMINLAALKVNPKDKPKIPMIRDKSTPNTAQLRRGTMTTAARGSVDKTLVNSLEEKYGKTIKNRGKKSDVFFL